MDGRELFIVWTLSVIYLFFFFAERKNTAIDYASDSVYVNCIPAYFCIKVLHVCATTADLLLSNVTGDGIADLFCIIHYKWNSIIEKLAFFAPPVSPLPIIPS